MITYNKQNGRRVGGFTVMNSHHTECVALPSGSFAAEDNHVTIKGSLWKAWVQGGKTLHTEPQECG